MLDKNHDAIRHLIREASDSITPYDVNNMKKVLESQKQMISDVLAKNEILVSENSELRMHM